jgi:MerR family Zn(II)-responsive transcriptional regulator of zntA
MLIGELAKTTGLSRDTIRFYEKLGLIESGDRRAGTRIYREYGADTLERLALIHQGKCLGFTLGEMKLLIEQSQGGELPTPEKIRVIEHKLEEIGEKMQQLHTMKTYLLAKLNELTQAP